MKKKKKNKTIRTKDDIMEQFIARAGDYLTTTHNPPAAKAKDQHDNFVEEHNYKVAEYEFKCQLIISSILSMSAGFILYFKENTGLITTLFVTFFLFCGMMVPSRK